MCTEKKSKLRTVERVLEKVKPEEHFRRNNKRLLGNEKRIESDINE